MISVCLCSYNGSQYIHEQISSILIQLSHEDELIISDDCSSDNTNTIVKNFNDSRIRHIKNLTNIGHVKNFQNAIAQCNGDYIFLSDQDDVWFPNKIILVMSVFNLKINNNVLLVHHELSYVNATLTPLSRPSRKLNFGKQNSISFILNQFYSAQIFGCGCAFRKDLKKWLLPFPNYTYAHDHWLAICASIAGDVFLMEAKLVSYRQHNNNLTPKNKLSFIKIIVLRIKLFTLFMISLFRFKKLVYDKK